MAQTDAEVLEQYKLARDAILATLAAGTQEVIELEIRNRRVRYIPTQANLKAIEELIKYYERKTSSGQVRNYANLRR